MLQRQLCDGAGKLGIAQLVNGHHLSRRSGAGWDEDSANGLPRAPRDTAELQPGGCTACTYRGVSGGQTQAVPAGTGESKPSPYRFTAPWGLI